MKTGILTADINQDISMFKEFMDTSWHYINNNASRVILNIVITLLIFLIGKKLIKSFMKFLKKIFERSKMDLGVQMFLSKGISILLYIILALVILERFGVQSSSFVAIIGSAGLTLGLALQGSLSNLAGGVLILILKPFTVGDYIIALGNEGTVTGIDIFYTRLTTVDNRAIVLPNGTLSNSNLINVTHEKVRRLDLNVGIDYAADIKTVKDVLTKLAEKHPMVLKDGYEITVFVNSFEASSIDMGLRVWCEKDNYWPLKWDLLEQIKYAFDENNIVIPFNQLDVTVKK